MKKKIRFFRIYHVHHKLGLMIFSFFMLLIFMLGSILYTLFVNFYLQQTVGELVHRSHGHAEALSNNFSQVTLRHVVEMEKNPLTSVVVIDSSGEILAQSDMLRSGQSPYLQPIKDADPIKYDLVEKDWRGKPFLVSKSTITIERRNVGTVIMFASTEPIRSAVLFLERILLGVASIALISSGILIYIISKFIARPLTKMRDAIERLTTNNYNFSLSTNGNDEIAELNRSIMTLSEELRHYRSTRQEFVEEISHELRTPISYIKGYTDILIKGTVSDERERQKYLHFIYEATNRLYRLIYNLFELVQLDQTHYSLRKKEVDLTYFIQQIIDEMEESFIQENLALQFHSSPRKPAVCLIDIERFYQVISNLLENAKKYTPAGGTVSVQLKQEHHQIKIQVADSGIGISKEDLPYIWQRFYRVEKSRSRQYGGAGLGLSICKRIIELHGGTIQAQSQPGIGTTFTLLLPALD